jgi:site-specific DNA-methyltransferase (adenine-specific)
MDALSMNWCALFVDVKNHFMWLNPPYSNIKDWVKKCYEENLRGAKIVLLIPARTDTKYFHQYIYHNVNAEIRFIKGRLKFSDSKNSAPFPSMVVVFR